MSKYIDEGFLDDTLSSLSLLLSASLNFLTRLREENNEFRLEEKELIGFIIKDYQKYAIDFNGERINYKERFVEYLPNQESRVFKCYRFLSDFFSSVDDWDEEKYMIRELKEIYPELDYFNTKDNSKFSQIDNFCMIKLPNGSSVFRDYIPEFSLKENLKEQGVMLGIESQKLKLTRFSEMNILDKYDFLLYYSKHQKINNSEIKEFLLEKY